MKIQIVKKGTAKAGAEICPWMVDVPMAEPKKG
jgi:hypothetical protein